MIASFRSLYTQLLAHFFCFCSVLLNSHVQLPLGLIHILYILYFFSHPVQSIVHTPSLGPVWSFGWTRRLFRVVCGFIAETMPLFLRISATFSESPFTLGSTSIPLICASFSFLMIPFLLWSLFSISSLTCLIGHLGQPQEASAVLILSLSSLPSSFCHYFLAS